MARYPGAEAIYQTATVWKDKCLIEESSLLWPESKVWSKDVLDRFKKCFIDNPDESANSFEDKFKLQLVSESDDVTRLSCELLLVYFLFTTGVGKGRKQELISTVASWKNLTVNFDSLPGDCLRSGIGNPGLAFNTRRPFELKFLAELAIFLQGKSRDQRKAILADDVQFRDIADQVSGENRYQSRDILLHLLFTDKYERIASAGHKNKIAAAFADVIPAPGAEDVDDRIYAIRKRLEELIPGNKLDFYEDPLRDCWYEAGEGDDLTPAQALSIKRQIVYYGPPGTGKTYDAKQLAALFIRQAVLHRWGPNKYFSGLDKVTSLVKKRIMRVQFHPGYGYEDLIRGLQIVDGGKTEYRDGILLSLLANLEKDNEDVRGLPYVLILDEMNRADLSKVLGECFSLLEDRKSPICLSGQPREIIIPENLFFIGTMNLIDQSLEQVDFALRRRFLWFFKGYRADDFLAVAEYRWNALFKTNDIRREWSYFLGEFDMLSERATRLNDLINNDDYLGHQYQIGHTYFCDVVHFAQKTLFARPRTQNLLFTANGHARDPIKSLWKYSLLPLLQQYLSGVDQAERSAFLNRAENVMFKGIVA